MKRYSKLQTCSHVILYSFSANSPSKQQGSRQIVIGAMGSVDRVITLGGGGGGVRKPETGIINTHYIRYVGLIIKGPSIPRGPQHFPHDFGLLPRIPPTGSFFSLLFLFYLHWWTSVDSLKPKVPMLASSSFVYIYIYIYVDVPRTQMTLVLIGTGPCFGGLTFKNGGHLGSRNIHMHMSDMKYIMYILAFIVYTWRYKQYFLGWCYVDGSEIRRSPVDMVNISLFTKGFIHPKGWVVWNF